MPGKKKKKEVKKWLETAIPRLEKMKQKMELVSILRAKNANVVVLNEEEFLKLQQLVEMAKKFLEE